MKSLFKKNKKKLQKNTSAKIDAKSLNDAGVGKRNKEDLKNTEKLNAIKKQKL